MNWVDLCLSSKVVFHKGCLPSKDIFHQRSSSIKTCIKYGTRMIQKWVLYLSQDCLRVLFTLVWYSSQHNYMYWGIPSFLSKLSNWSFPISITSLFTWYLKFCTFFTKGQNIIFLFELPGLLPGIRHDPPPLNGPCIHKRKTYF